MSLLQEHLYVIHLLSHHLIPTFLQTVTIVTDFRRFQPASCSVEALIHSVFCVPGYEGQHMTAVLLLQGNMSIRTPLKQTVKISLPYCYIAISILSQWGSWYFVMVCHSCTLRVGKRTAKITDSAKSSNHLSQMSWQGSSLMRYLHIFFNFLIDHSWISLTHLSDIRLCKISFHIVFDPLNLHWSIHKHIWTLGLQLTIILIID